MKEYFEDRRGLTLIGSIALGMLALFLLTHLFAGFHRNDKDNEHVITVNGTAEVLALPDTATFTFSVVSEASTVTDAQKKAEPIINKALAYLKEQGVDEKDVKNENYNANPKYEYKNQPCTPYSCPPSNPTIVGYQVDQTISVKVRDTSKAGTLLGGIGATGVSNISGLTFTIDDEDALKGEARAKAIEKAREQAKVLAKDLGVRLGDVTSFSEQTGGYPPIYYSKDTLQAEGRGASVAPAPQVPTGQNKITSNVTVTYKIR
jgi:uncharacterized protein